MSAHHAGPAPRPGRAPVRDKSLVRASDLSAWAYCQRAWWLANVQGATHEEPAQLEMGRTLHARHGSRAARAVWMQRIGRAAILTALVLALLALLWLLIG